MEPPPGFQPGLPRYEGGVTSDMTKAAWTSHRNNCVSGGMEPEDGDDPSSLPYRGRALPLSYTGLEWSTLRDPTPLRLDLQASASAASA